MNIQEVAALIAAAAVFDERVEVEELTVRLWAKALGHLTYPDAEDAVVWHYQRSPYKIRPKDVIDRVNAVQRARLERCPLPAPALPAASEDDDDPATRRRQASEFIRQLRGYQQLVKTGSVSRDSQHFLALVRQDRPVVEPPRQRALAAADETAGVIQGHVLEGAPPNRDAATERALADATRYLGRHLADPDLQEFMDAAKAELDAQHGGSDYDTALLTIRAAALMRAARPVRPAPDDAGEAADREAS